MKPDINKVIQGLEACAEINGNMGVPNCKKCPYFRKDGCTETIVMDAINVLKTLQPRVLTSEEVQTIGKAYHESDTIVWVERKDGTYPAEISYDFDPGWQDEDENEVYVYRFGTDCYRHYHVTDYGKTWRCWSARPTDGQREAAKWDE